MCATQMPGRVPDYSLLEQAAAPAYRTGPSLAEQMGTDPTSKLAAAIDRLAAALEKLIAE